jgi:hypothetical protein
MGLGLLVGNRCGGVVVGNGFGLADLSLGLPISTWWWVRNELISAWWWVLRNEEGRNEEEKRNKEREKKKVKIK